MEYMDQQQQPTQGQILCCQCGIPIAPNPANMCVACLRTQVDITEGIPKQGTLYFCKACERYLQPPAIWVACALESRELLALCLKKIKGLAKVRLVDAGFIWTEPHSKRIKVKLTIQKEVMGGAILEQVFVVEFTVQNQMCTDCHRVEAKDFWKAVVQLRQKTSHKKTFYYLEQLILKHNVHSNTLNIKQHDEGLDFFYSCIDHARKMVDFLRTVVPCRYKTSQQLLSHDVHSNTFNYKHTFSVEIVPVCKDDVVCLPKKLGHSLGNMGQICVCTRVTTTAQVMDPNTLQVGEISGPAFWRSPFQTICDSKQLTEYIVLQIERLEDKDRRHVKGEGARSQKHLLSDVWVMRAQDMGVTDSQYHCRTHLGHILKAGDSVLGFDMASTNVNDANLEKINPDNLPDVVLVKKHYGDRVRRHRKRNWKLKGLNKDDARMDTDSADGDYIGFLEDLEEDTEYRRNINIYRDKNKVPVEQSDTEEEDAPKISLQEMLDDLHLTDDETGLDEQGAAAI
ncbi:60S ribosomal export protein NMD3-like [Amphiura filiformis]|uniref:60S ribosomal export protein NMD3-like n=1 Tax=Amphiura filiformis TaxID=82378 RepID=UPI003B215049